MDPSFKTLTPLDNGVTEYSTTYSLPHLFISEVEVTTKDSIDTWWSGSNSIPANFQLLSASAGVLCCALQVCVQQV